MQLQDRYLERVDMREPSPSEMPLFISPTEIQKITSSVSGVKALRRFVGSNKTVYICSEADEYNSRTIKGITVTTEKAVATVLDTDDHKIVVIDKYGEYWQLSELVENNNWLYFPPSENNPLGDLIIHDWRSYFKHNYHKLLERAGGRLRKLGLCDNINTERELLSVFVSSLYEKRLKGLRVKDPLKYEQLYGRITRRRAYFQVSLTILQEQFKIRQSQIGEFDKRVIARVFLEAIKLTGFKSSLDHLLNPYNFFLFCKKQILLHPEVLNPKRDLHKHMKSDLLGMAKRKHQILVQDWADDGLTFKTYEKWSQIVVMAQLEILLDQARDKYHDLVPDFKVDLTKDPIVQLEEFTSELFKDTSNAIYDFHKLHGFYVTSQRRVMTEHPFLNITNRDILVSVMKTVLYVTRFVRAKLPRNHPLKPVLTIKKPFSYLTSGYKLSIIKAKERLMCEGIGFVLVDPLKLTKDELSSHISNCLRDCKKTHWEIKKTEDLEFEKITGLPMNFVFKRLKSTVIYASD